MKIFYFFSYSTMKDCEKMCNFNMNLISIISLSIIIFFYMNGGDDLVKHDVDEDERLLRKSHHKTPKKGVNIK